MADENGAVDPGLLALQEGYKKYRIHQAYVEGYDKGLNWPDAWEIHNPPGGPFYPSRGPDAQQLRAENEAWREGWKEGHADKLATGRSVLSHKINY